jgi:hypothetical protein
MTRDDLREMLAGQTPACGPAREALLSGGVFEVWDGLVPASRHLGVYSVRRRITRRRGQPTLGLDETIGILGAMGEEPLRTGEIRTADQGWAFLVFLDAAATKVLACTGVARRQG